MNGQFECDLCETILYFWIWKLVSPLLIIENLQKFHSETEIYKLDSTSWSSFPLTIPHVYLFYLRKGLSARNEEGIQKVSLLHLGFGHQFVASK